MATSNPESLLRSKHGAFHAINSLKSTATELSKRQPSLENVQKAGVLLESWRVELQKVNTIDEQLMDFIDKVKCNTHDLVLRAECEITKDYEKSYSELNKLKGEFVAMKANIEKAERENQTVSDPLNSTFVQFDRMNSLAKLPDIDVPKFDGNIENYTEWQSLFEAIINSNEALKPQQKMYFLKNAMQGKASTILKDYPIDGTLYDAAYEHVKKRYYNRRKIIENHFYALFELPAINSSNIRESLKVQATVRGLTACNIDTSKMSPIIAYALVRKLPDRIRQDWENSQHDFSTYSSFEPLSSWLNNRCFAIESSNYSENARKSSNFSKSPQPTRQAKQTSENRPKSSLPVTNATKPTTYPSVRCIGCNENHYLSQCTTFLAKPVPERETFVGSKRLCRNCLRPGHSTNQCHSSKCRKCHGNHHTTLHAKPNSPILLSTANAPDSSSKISLTAVRCDINVLLPTAVVKVRIGKRYVLARALIDSCSQVNLVTESFVNRYRIEKTPSASSICGVSSSCIRTNHVVSLHIESRINEHHIRMDAESSDLFHIQARHACKKKSKLLNKL